jgi:acyl carrier protein
MNEPEIKATAKDFLLREFLPGEDPAALTDSTPLVTTGILDSIAVLKVVTFLENEFGITIEPHEAVVENLNTVSDIARLVVSKKAAS